MAVEIVIKELIKKKDELSIFINKLENIIKEKKEEIYHLDNTLKIFENDSQNNSSELMEQTTNPNIIKHDFNNSIDITADTQVSDNIKKAIKKQSQKVEKLHSDEKEILKQFKQLMKG